MIRMKLNHSKPYTYLVICKPTKEFYYGVRTSKNCNPNEFFKEYFTSSKKIHLLIDKYGVNNFDFQIRKIFDCKEKAKIWESKVIKKIYKNDKCLNGHWMKNPDHETFVKMGKAAAVTNKNNKTGMFHDKKLMSNGGKIGGKIVKENGNGIFKYDRSSSEYLKFCSMGGINAQQTLKKLKICCFYNDELRRKCASKAGKKGGWTMPHIQSKNGKKGGIKNKNKVWVNDGAVDKKCDKNILYKFLYENPSFKKGRLLSTIKGKIWINNGIKNKALYENAVDIFLKSNPNYKRGRLWKSK